MRNSRLGPVRFLAAVLFLTIPFSLIAKGEFEKSALTDSGSYKTAKYVFLFIGDGMALPQVSTTEIFANAIASKDITVKQLGFTKFPVQGVTTTYDASSFITDSASAGTAMATGYKTLSGVINYDTARAKTFKPITEYAKEKGMRVGIVSSVSLDHATPASFYAKAKSRSEYYDIAVQLTKSGFDYYAGGGFLQEKGSKGDQPGILEMAKAAGYTYVNSTEALNALKPGSGKVLAVSPVLQDSSALEYDMDRAATTPSLADYTRKGIELLDNTAGFFMMVEGGKIDWSCHANDAAATVRDVISFDKAVSEALAFAGKHPDDTLILVTGDHETGGMTIGFAGTGYATSLDKIALQKASYVKFNDAVVAPYKKSHTSGNAKIEDILPAVTEYFGLKATDLNEYEQQLVKDAFARSMAGKALKSKEEDALLYGGYEALTVTLTHILNQKAGIGWTTYAHTGVPVTTFASGAGQEMFGGYYDNTDIFRKLMQVMNLAAAVAVK